MQRAILDALAARPGGDMIVDGCGHRAWLGGGVHDLRQLSREMTRAAGTQDCQYAASSWQVSFSRGISGLLKRGVVEILWSVPLEAIEPEFVWPVVEVDGAIYMQWYSRQRRFVRAQNFYLTHTAAALSDTAQFR